MRRGRSTSAAPTFPEPGAGAMSSPTSAPIRWPDSLPARSADARRWRRQSSCTGSGSRRARGRNGQAEQAGAEAAAATRA